jgi:crotonobetainyl-CoA:carnitine CoA-transferase CaiB-like acyl-CoA transferase
MLALDGVRVIDLSRAVPGPYCSMLLGDMGADVLLVEEPAAAARGLTERDVAFDALRRNKRSICLDLKHEEGRTIFHRLAATADVILEGFRPGVVDRLGVGYDAVRAHNPRAVYCSLSGYGQDGPYSGLAGHDINYVALGGALGMIGRPGAAPSIPMNLVADMAGGGLMAAFSITAALLARERTGRGQYVDVAMSDGVIALLTRAASQYFTSGTVPRPGEGRITGALPHYDVYECKDGRFLSVGPLEPKFLAILCDAIGLPELAAHGEAAPAEDRELVRAAFRARFLERTRDEWFVLLRSRDACAAPVYSLDEVFEDAHHLHRRMLVHAPHPTLGPVPQVGIGPKLSETPGAVRSTGPLPGQHTGAVLGELGFSAEDVARLRSASAVA